MRRTNPRKAWGFSGRRTSGEQFAPMVVASPAGFEPTAPRLGIWCSILLSYGDDSNRIPQQQPFVTRPHNLRGPRFAAAALWRTDLPTGGAAGQLRT